MHMGFGAIASNYRVNINFRYHNCSLGLMLIYFCYINRFVFVNIYAIKWDWETVMTLSLELNGFKHRS